MKTSFTAKAPAKLIISGEHSVVYGAPAIAMAINKYVTTTVGWVNKDNYNNPSINFNMLNLKYAKSYTLKALILLKNRLQSNYNAFLTGNCNIKEVIKKPFELLQYSVTNLIDKLQLQLSASLDIKVDSSIPIGAGLGSSAAVIISCLRSLVHLFKLTWDPAKFLKIGRDIENLQHGHSSGIDLSTAIFGGCAYFNSHLKNIRQDLILPDFNLTMVNTGIPLATTGECVTKVKNYFLLDAIIEEFSKITEIIKQAIINNNKQQFLEGIKENHSLLCHIGVVPQKIKNFIKEIELIGGAGKVCGAGSICGNNAGVVLLIGEQEEINKIAYKYQYNLQNIGVDYGGVTIVK